MKKREILFDKKIEIFVKQNFVIKDILDFIYFLRPYFYILYRLFI